MTLVATPSIKERLNYNFVNLFKTSRKLVKAVDLPRKPNPAIDRLIKNEIIFISSLTTSPADGIFLLDRYAITFRLSDKFSNHFVLLRGLLEFSRPKTIVITPNATDKTFHIALSETQADHFVAHLDTILGWLIKEIKFKESLRALITFEKKVKREQAIFYANMRKSA
jgi:hypothetical protein